MRILTSSAGISRSCLQTAWAKSRRAGDILTKIQLLNDFLHFATLRRPHIHLTGYIRGIWIRSQRSLEARHVVEVWRRWCGVQVLDIWDFRRCKRVVEATRRLSGSPTDIPGARFQRLQAARYYFVDHNMFSTTPKPARDSCILSEYLDRITLSCQPKIVSLSAMKRYSMLLVTEADSDSIRVVLPVFPLSFGLLKCILSTVTCGKKSTHLL